MDLKIKDVADLLNVSETTIRRWLADGKIPAYRLNHQYRFSRMEIEEWVMSCKLKHSEEGFLSFSKASEEKKSPSTPDEEEVEAASPQGRGQLQFSLYRAIHQGGVFTDIPGTHKEDLIRETMNRSAPRLGLDPDVLAELLLDREALMPTALNNGIAVPHTRDFLLQGHNDTIVVVFPSEPIEFGALDGEAVHTLFFLFAHDDKMHLHLLAKLAHLSSDPASLELLRSRPSSEELLEFIKGWESQIPQPAEYATV
jgi:PTS system nitrogen regulatory IIA component